jgi:hypothetical protein
MELLNYARRCKKKTGHERHETLHAADNNATFCGKELNEMWYVESNAGLEPEDVSCKECRRLMRSNKLFSSFRILSEANPSFNL